MGTNTQPSGATSLTLRVDGPDVALPVRYRDDPSDDVYNPTLSGDGADAVASVVPFGLGAIASAGDSIADVNQQVSGLAFRKRARGSVVWALAFAGQPFDYLESDDFAVGGTDSAHLLNVQVPLIEAAVKAGRRYARIYVSCGTNDFQASGLSAATTIANLRAAFRRLRAIGAQVDWVGIRPRGTAGRASDADSSFTLVKQHAATVNAAMSAAHLAGEFNFITDVLEAYADNSTAFGNMLAATNYDGLHPNHYGACLEGKLLAQAWLRDGIGVSMRLAGIAGDIFARNGNVGGVVSPNPLLAGGTTAPTGFTTSGGTWSKASRTLSNGQTRSDPTCALTTATNHFISVDITATGAWAGNTQVAAGDVVEGRALVKLTGASGIRRVSLLIQESNGTGVSDELQHYDLFTESADTSALPLTGDETLWLRVPRCPIRAYDGAGNASLRLRLEIETATGVGAGTATVMGLELRPVSLAA